MATENLKFNGSDVEGAINQGQIIDDGDRDYSNMTEVNGVWKHDEDFTDAEISDEYDDVERAFVNGQIDREERDEEYDALDRRFCKIQSERYGVPVKTHRELLRELELEEKNEQESDEDESDEDESD